MLGRRKFALRLVRWRRGRDELHEVELERLTHLFRRPQMTEVDRIETSAEQSYPHLIRRTLMTAALNFPYLPRAMNHVLVSGQLVQSHRTARVQAVR